MEYNTTIHNVTTGRMELHSNPVALTLNLKSVPKEVSGENRVLENYIYVNTRLLLWEPKVCKILIGDQEKKSSLVEGFQLFLDMKQRLQLVSLFFNIRATVRIHRPPASEASRKFSGSKN